MHQPPTESVAPEVFVVEYVWTSVQTIKAFTLAQAAQLAKEHARTNGLKIMAVKTLRIYEAEQDEAKRGKKLTGDK
jgi:hypothetical protein